LRAAISIVFRSPYRSMLKPGHRLAGLGDRVHHPLGPLRLDADDDRRGHVRVAPGARQRAESQVEVLAELQPAVGVGQGHRALDQGRHAVRGRVRDVVDRQDDDVVADAEPPVWPPVAEQLHLLRLSTAKREPLRVRLDDFRRRRLFQAPPHRLKVMRVNVPAAGDCLRGLADGAAVLEQLVPRGHVAHRHLVPERHVLRHREVAVLLPLQRDDPYFLAGLQVAHCHAYVVDGLVNQDTVCHNDLFSFLSR
jgi:hypothetical protein